MKEVMKKFWILAMLTMVSSVAMADEKDDNPAPEEPTTVKVDLNDSYTGGTVEVTDYSDPAEDGSVVVTILVTPDDGYIIAKEDILVIPTIPSGSQGTRDGTPGFADALEVVEVEGEDYTDLTQRHSYQFTVPANLGAWVKEANFHFANDISGDEDSEVAWRYDAESNSITITGNGTTCDFDGNDFTDPWAAFRETIESVLIGEGVTSLGKNIFAGCTSLTIITVENNKAVLILGEGAIPEGIDINVPGNLYNEYLTTDGWKDLGIISKEAIEMTGVEFGANNEYDTFVSDEALMVPSVLSAFIISGIDEDGLVLTPVDVIPAGVPVLVFSKKELKGNDFRTSATEGEPMRITSLLKVVTEKDGLTVELGEVYMLYNDVFYYTQAGTIPQGGIYLVTSVPNERARSSYPIGTRSDTTGITTLRTDGSLGLSGNAAWYSLDGRQLNTMPTRKGIYIHNGKLMIIK